MTQWTRLDSHLAAPDSPGCYALYDLKGLLYIGSSMRLRERLIEQMSYWRKHQRRRIVTIKIAKCPVGWVKREKRLIQRVEPHANIHWTTRPRRRHAVRDNRCLDCWTDSRNEYVRRG